MAPAEVDRALAEWAGLDERALGRPWAFRGQTMDVRYALFRTLEDAQEAVVRVAARPMPESRRVLALAQRAFGDLRGLLIGLPDDLLDRIPGEKEWPLRETLRHIVFVERRYALQTLWAVERTDTDTMRIADDRLPALAGIDVAGGIAAILGRVADARAETQRTLADLPPAAMTRPTGWVKYDVDVRFRLHRFAAHLIEHTVQCEKTLAALGWRPAEGRQIVRRLTAGLGEVEALGGEADARAVERAIVERAASTAAAT